jgi:hypothetical protein
MTDQELRDLVASLAVKSDRMDAQLAKSDAKLDRIAEMVGGISNNQGDVAEEFFYNSLVEKPEIGGIEFDTITPNLIIGSKRSQAEFDLVLVNGRSVALIEVKYKAHQKSLDQIEGKIAQYRSLRPEHKDYTVYAGLAGFSIPPDIQAQALERGLFVLRRKGEVIEVDSKGMRGF